MIDSYDVGFKRQYQLITEKSRIISMLQDCANQQSNLHLSLFRTSEFFSTVVEDIDTLNDKLYIAELLPRSGQKLLRDVEHLQVFTQVNGSEISFESRVTRVKSPLFRTRNCLRLPEKIKYFQRRRMHRVLINAALDVQARLNQAGQSLMGQVRDLSPDGMRIQFHRLAGNELDQFNAVNECIINLPDNEYIQCKFKIRHITTNNNKHATVLGGSFIGLELPQKRSLENFLATLEHETRSNQRVSSANI